MHTSPVSKTAYRIALFTLLLLGLGAAFCYRERMLFSDSAWIIFNVLNGGDFLIAEHRWGAVSTQWVLLLGSKLGVSLKVLLLSYSVGYYVFYLGVALLAGRHWKEPGLAILLVLYLTLFVSDGYFWPNNEVQQGTAWGVLFLAAFFRSGKPPQRGIWAHLFLIITLLLALSSHLLVALPLGFLWAYRHWQNTPSFKKILVQRETIFYSALIMLLTLGRYWLSTGGWYDGGKLEPVKALSAGRFLRAFSSAQSRSFLHLLGTHYVLLLPLILVGFAALLRHRQFLLLGLTLVWATLYYGLVCTVFGEAIRVDSRFYMESEWLGLSLILATPFVMEGATFLKSPKVFAGILAFVLALRLTDIAHSYELFQGRYQQLAYTTQKLHAAGIPKAVIQLSETQWQKRFLMVWATAAESLMLSRLEEYSPAVSFKVMAVPPGESPTADSFLSAFSTVSAGSLNATYFRPDTTTQYRFIKGAAFFR